MTLLSTPLDPYTQALRSESGPLFLRRTDGWMLPLEVERWCAEADAADRSVLDRCRGPVLDIGCGPGRIVAALTTEARICLGVDVSAEAVERTVQLGGTALRRSVFDPLPGEGRWGSALLLDGNIGIGGNPAQLLHRSAQLVASNGVLIVETAPADLDECVEVQLDDGRGRGGWTDSFMWARVGNRALRRYAKTAKWKIQEEWISHGRTFVALRRGRVTFPEHASSL